VACMNCLQPGAMPVRDEKTIVGINICRDASPFHNAKLRFRV
jgi:hypothetical protein